MLSFAFDCKRNQIVVHTYSSHFKDRQHRVAADLQYSRLSLTYFLSSWIKIYTVYGWIANSSMYLFI